MAKRISRRELIGTGAAAASAMALSRLTEAAPHPNKVATFAFMTDCHLPATGQNERIVKAFEKVQSDSRNPEFIVFGGDNVFAVDGKSSKEGEAQFTNWQKALKENVSLPCYHVIGNHDICNDPAEGEDDPRAGKGFALEAFAIPHRYYSFDKANWRIVILDTFHRDGCHVDSEQLEWVKSEMRDVRKNVLLVSHAPILTVTSYIESSTHKNGAFHVPAGWMTANAAKLRDEFRSFPNIRLALSGHMHQIDRVEFDHLTYICGGAVSGAWWNGDYYHFPPAYIIVELYDDGSFAHKTVYWEKS
jgi:hypothetical protein